MDIKANAQDSPERVLASLSPETLDSLAELVVAKLTANNGRVLLPKQDVEGSNPFTRSIDSFRIATNLSHALFLFSDIKHFLQNDPKNAYSSFTYPMRPLKKATFKLHPQSGQPNFLSIT